MEISSVNMLTVSCCMFIFLLLLCMHAFKISSTLMNPPPRSPDLEPILGVAQSLGEHLTQFSLTFGP